MKEILTQQRAIEKRLGITETKEIPGNIAGFPGFYDVGSFVPTWVGSSTPGTFTYTANATLVEWSRIGNRLLFSGRIAITAIGVAPVGTLQLAGFPFAAVSDTNMLIAGGASAPFWAANVAAGYTQVGFQATNGSTLLIATKAGDNLAPSSVAGSELIVGDWRFEGHYRVA